MDIGSRCNHRITGKRDADLIGFRSNRLSYANQYLEPYHGVQLQGLYRVAKLSIYYYLTHNKNNIKNTKSINCK